MKLKPMLFSTAMVQAILDGRKTQTRRVVEHIDMQKTPHLHSSTFDDHILFGDDENVQNCINKHHIAIRRKTGDLIWVRESWQYALDHMMPFPSYDYRADFKDERAANLIKWKPSIHMPYTACRLWLKVTGVKVERLKSISTVDAMAEGVRFTDFGTYVPSGGASIDGGKTFHPFKPQQHNGFHVFDVKGPDECLGSAYSAFGNLWAKINGEESWNANPWVWVISFERTEKPAA